MSKSQTEMEIEVAMRAQALGELARNLGVPQEKLDEILREVNAQAAALPRHVSVAERLIEARARLMRAALA